ncbi:MAG: SIS domain-containing protein, partial [Phycisphaerales bacterium]|nr:SIS domain-containing protein [Phycisphaerales bacterium]
RAAMDAFLADDEAVARVGDASRRLAEVFRSGHKVLALGNGGSACDAMHFCEELTGRFRADRDPLPAIACIDPGHLTCTANDYGFEQVFARWVRALGAPGDALVVLSTSGNSPNVVRAVEAASDMTTIALLGPSGGALRGRCDLEWRIDAATPDRIQEVHMTILHTLIEGVEIELGMA